MRATRPFVVESIRAAEEDGRRASGASGSTSASSQAPKITLDNIFKHLEKAGRKELALVVKGDVQGSVEALKGMLAKLRHEEVMVSVKSASAGGINETDVDPRGGHQGDHRRLQRAPERQGRVSRGVEGHRDSSLRRSSTTRSTTS